MERQIPQKKSTVCSHKLHLGGKHTNGPTVPELSSAAQYKSPKLKNVAIKYEKGDNCVKIGRQIGIVENILNDTIKKDTFWIWLH